MPALSHAELGFNRLSHLFISALPPAPSNSLETLNLDSNQCNDWADICSALAMFPK
jgi:hypothetical protein